MSLGIRFRQFKPYEKPAHRFAAMLRDAVVNSGHGLSPEIRFTLGIERISSESCYLSVFGEGPDGDRLGLVARAQVAGRNDHWYLFLLLPDGAWVQVKPDDHESLLAHVALIVKSPSVQGMQRELDHRKEYAYR